MKTNKILMLDGKDDVIEMYSVSTKKQQEISNILEPKYYNHIIKTREITSESGLFAVLILNTDEHVMQCVQNCKANRCNNEGLGGVFKVGGVVELDPNGDNPWWKKVRGVE